MENTIEIRPFAFAELPSVVELIKSSKYAMPYAFQNLTSKEILRILYLRLKYEKYIDRLKRFAFKGSLRYLFTNKFDRILLVAQDAANKKILGATLFSNPFDDIWSLDIIIVSPTLRTKGIGKKLLDAVLMYVKSRGGSQLTVSTTCDNIAALNLYSRYSFKENFRIVELKLDLRS